jgi:hypothetical protein
MYLIKFVIRLALVASIGGQALANDPLLCAFHLSEAAEAGDLNRLNQVLRGCDAAKAKIRSSHVPYWPQMFNFDQKVQEEKDFSFLIAAEQGHLPIVKRLVEVGANLDSVAAWNGNTALHFAAELGNEPMVDYLIDQGASSSIQNRKGISAYYGYKLVRSYDDKQPRLYIAAGASMFFVPILIACFFR